MPHGQTSFWTFRSTRGKVIILQAKLSYPATIVQCLSTCLLFLHHGSRRFIRIRFLSWANILQMAVYLPTPLPQQKHWKLSLGTVWFGENYLLWIVKKMFVLRRSSSATICGFGQRTPICFFYDNELIFEGRFKQPCLYDI